MQTESAKAAWQRWVDKNPQKRAAIMERHRAKYEREHRVQIRARKLLSYHVCKGNIRRPKKCSVCGRRCKPHGHHENYANPLEVIWVCEPCHRDIHASEVNMRRVSGRF